MSPIKMKSPPKSILGPAESNLPGFGNRSVTERQYSTSGIKPEGSPWFIVQPTYYFKIYIHIYIDI